MDTGRDRATIDQLIHVAHLPDGSRQRHYRAVGRGEFVAIVPGTFLPAETATSIDRDARARLLARAAATRFGGELPLSHFSAAAMWGLPMVDAWPARADVLLPRTSGGRSAATIRRRAGRDADEVVEIDGLPVTSLARTLVDVARVAGARVAVPMLDHALGGHDAARLARTDLDAVLGEWAAIDSEHGRSRARRSIGFADGRSGSPGESLSRVVIAELGFPPPDLQRRFRDAEGVIGATDFFWESAQVVGEFDGRVKYEREEFLRGGTASDAVVREKLREDRLRRLGPTVARWTWGDARTPMRLRVILLAAGLRPRRMYSRTLAEVRSRV